MKPIKTKRPNKRTRAKSSRKATVLLTVSALATIAAAAYLYWGARSATPPETGTARTLSADAMRKFDMQRLVDDWVRPDGGYVISIRRIFPDGRAEAAYLNPRRINVARAEVSAAGETVKLFMELRDVGYPGSTYELIYDRGNDVLAGVYFQAAMGQRFNVVFGRAQ